MTDFRKYLRMIARKIAWISGLAAAVLFVAGVFMQDANPLIRYIWQGSAITGLLAFAIETWLRRLDEREAKKTIDDLRAQFIEEAEMLRYQQDEEKKRLEGRIRRFEDIERGIDPDNPSY